MIKGKPITPQEAKAVAVESIPPEVFDAFNELLAAQGHATTIHINQDTVVALIVRKMTASTDVISSEIRQKLFNMGWLDIEEAYKKAGWRVSYDKPGYNETGPAIFTFSAK